MISSNAVRASLIVIAFAVFGCGRENFIPSAPGDFEPRNTEESVVVLERDAPEMKEYKRIGTALIKAKKDLNALKGCRAVAAENGGDAIITPDSQGKKEWKCVVLRRLDQRVTDDSPVPQRSK